jgi:hypothetical protein
VGIRKKEEEEGGGKKRAEREGEKIEELNHLLLFPITFFCHPEKKPKVAFPAFDLLGW